MIFFELQATVAAFYRRDGQNQNRLCQISSQFCVQIFTSIGSFLTQLFKKKLGSLFEIWWVARLRFVLTIFVSIQICMHVCMLLSLRPGLWSLTEGNCRDHRHSIDKYLDTRSPIATAADRVATDHSQKSQSQGGLPELLLAYSCLTNHSKAASLWSVTPKQVVRTHQWCVVCFIVEYLLIFTCKTCAHRTLRLFSSGHLAIIITPVASGLFMSSAPVV